MLLISTSRTLAIVLALQLSTIATHNAYAETGPSSSVEPSGRVGEFINGFDIALDISEDESKAEANIGGFFSAKTFDSDKKKELATTWKLGIELPVGGGDNVLESETQNKLGDGVKLSASFGLLGFSYQPDSLDSPPFGLLMDEAREACYDQAKEGLAKEADCTASIGRPSEGFVRLFLPAAVLRMNRIRYNGFWTLAATASVGINKHIYFTPLTLAENSDRKVGYSIGIDGVYYPSDAVSAWKLGSEYSRSYKDADAAILCKAVVVNPDDDCVAGAPTQPSLTDALVFRAEYRRFFPFASGKSGIGAAITGSVDALTGDYDIELPVYFGSIGKSPFAPGIKIGYSSEKNDVIFGLFLKTSFGY